ncbi:hypothetical protein L218DRAFT_948430 [Marasmius fiardii PR-910]|nr:hypothetical protein L218DRAFT_948430 [Marasmius fiardii PR-910]
MTSFFEGASKTQFFGNPFFTNANTVINNFHKDQALPGSEPDCSSGLSNHEGSWLRSPHGRQRFRSIVMCDINLLREVSVQTVDVLVNLRALKLTNPFRGRLEVRGGSVKFGDRLFTVVSFEPENEGDVKKIQTVFGVELVCAQDIVKQYQKAPIVFQYLLYRINTSYDAVVDEGILQKLSIRFSEEIRDWIFNLRTRSFQYDITSNAHFAKYNPPIYFRNRVHPLPPSCNPVLKSREILRVIPEYLHLISDLACTTYVECTTDFVRHGVLTFGAVVERTLPGILGHFPSIPSPQWYWENHSPDIDARYSQSGDLL